MNATLSNPNHPEYGVATLPFPLPDEEYERCISMLEALEIGDVTAHDCRVDKISGAPPALDMLEGTLINVDELDFLARSLDRFTDEELAKFQSLTVTWERRDMETLINLSFSCEQATVITDFSKLEEAGKSHYLTTHGGAVPVEEYNQLDGERIARSLIADGEGKITPYGVVFENAMHLKPLYIGYGFPAYMDQQYLMEFTTETYREGEITFFLPQPEKRLERLLERSKIGQSEEIDIRTWHSELPDAVMDRLDFPHESLFEMNRLCNALKKLNEAELRKLSAVVMYAEPENALQMRQLAENLAEFDFVPDVKTPEEYGRHMIEESGHFEYDPNLEEYYDFAKYGSDHISRQEGEFNGLGYVSYHGTLSLDELMMEDPAEMEMGGMTC